MPRTVLIVDDERDTNDILASLVQARDFEPIQLFSGAQVVNAVREKSPDIILLDLMLPGKDGVAICRELRADLHAAFVRELHGVSGQVDDNLPQAIGIAAKPARDG